MKTFQLYESFDDDFYDDGCEHRLPDGYKFVRNSFFARIASAVSYALAVIFGFLYCKLFLGLKIEGAEKLRQHRGAFFLYGNHTQPVGDVVIPALACFPKRIYTVVSPANLDLPVIGRILPFLGALPTDGTLRGTKELAKAVKTRTDEGHPIVIYPEAHVWPYYTKIRPFGNASFSFPMRHGLPSFSMTSTYRKRKFGKRPRLVLVIDGPFYSEADRQTAPEQLRRAVTDSMNKAAVNSDCEYITYIKNKSHPD